MEFGVEVFYLNTSASTFNSNVNCAPGRRRDLYEDISGTWNDHFFTCIENEERKCAFGGSGRNRAYFLGCGAVGEAGGSASAFTERGVACYKGFGRNQDWCRDLGLWGHTLVDNILSL